MKFLVDAQLPEKLCEILTEKDIEAEHVISLPDGDMTLDSTIIEYADKNNLTVITKDLDFYHSHMISQSPRKLLLINNGEHQKQKTL